MAPKHLPLFGGQRAWDPDDWTDSDDRVRGGKSQSYLECSSEEVAARFHGNLDINTLGGAGFASQRTTGEDRTWDLDSYDGIEVVVEKADKKLYTFILKDKLQPKDPDTGREQSTISYEYDFNVKSSSMVDTATSHTIFIPWKSLKATYRGKEKSDAPKLNTKKVKRFSIKMRSFFRDQAGPFSMSIKSISAVKGRVTSDEKLSVMSSHAASDDSSFADLEKARLSDDGWVVIGFDGGRVNQSWYSRLVSSGSGSSRPDGASGNVFSKRLVIVGMVALAMVTVFWLSQPSIIVCRFPNKGKT